jgi:hypothetical protein
VYILILGGNALYSQTRVSGFVRDSVSEELLIGAHIYEYGTLSGILTDNNGHFSLISKSDSLVLQVSFMGYITKSFRIIPGNDTIVNILMQKGRVIEEVVIKSYRKNELNTSRLSSAELTYIPSIGAETDVLKTLQLLPGIQSQNEGSSNLLVRGGGPGQNLFLLDNIPIFYVNHLGGFVSVFNPDIINDIHVIKGGFPAKYGGRLSSIVDITLKEGNKAESGGSAGIGLFGGNITLEGPLFLKNSSYMFTCRKTFSELLLWLTGILTDQDYRIIYGFYDINSKISWMPDEKNSLHLIFYHGDDQINTFRTEESTKLRLSEKWGNVMIAGRWKSLISTKLFSTNSISFTSYRLKDNIRYSFPFEDSTIFKFETHYLSSVKDFSIKTDWNYHLFQNWIIDFGIQTSSIHFTPNKTYQSKKEKKQHATIIHSLESAIYLENRITFFERINLNLGTRFVNYNSWDISNFSFEPRLDLNWEVIRNHYMNFTYMRSCQYSHLIFTSGNFVNNEIWVPTIPGIDHSSSSQVTAGWEGSFNKRMIRAGLNLYLKRMGGLIAYKEGYINLMGDAYWKSKIETDGVGKAMGIELYLRKNSGCWTGFLSYSLSSSTRQFENINKGHEYLFEYDRPHCFAIDINRELNKNLIINAAWIYQTGIPYTPAIGRTFIPYTNEEIPSYDFKVLIYGDRNSERLRNYHRLDIALHYTKINKRNRKTTWSFSIYNVYCRQNPYYYYYNTNSSTDFNWNSTDSTESLKLYQRSFFPIIPSLSYKIFF